ncbi:hypothetical protein [Cupriavidus basilensis]|uniref:Type IV pilus biogenesis protein PilP n=1 Tax=Cupriavidus basilensis TaxID=68895 RepID=A0A643FSN0_9BURK|nr:hypothetical protein [Cupriavidus basilensis]QOT82248.1 hypothetical protein F7R26_039760 [Cupriavidus basilensis]
MRIGKYAVVIGVAAISSVAVAANVASEDQLGEVNAQTILLKAQAKMEEARQDLVSKSGGGYGDNGVLPNVLKIDRVNDDPVTAELIFAGNVKVEARQGTRLPGGFRVDAINMTARTVDLTRGKERYTVGMSSSVPQQQKPAQGTPNFGPTGSPYVPSVAR